MTTERTYNCNFEPPPGYEPWGDGHDWIDYLNSQPGTAVLPNWGAHGWDLGSWPYVSMAIRRDAEGGTWTTISYCEGDITETTYATKEDMYAGIDSFAEFNWRIGQSDGPDDIANYPKGELPTCYRGPYSSRRHDEVPVVAKTVTLATPEERNQELYAAYSEASDQYEDARDAWVRGEDRSSDALTKLHQLETARDEAAVTYESHCEEIGVQPAGQEQGGIER